MFKLLSRINLSFEMNRTFRLIGSRLLSSKNNSLNLSGVYPPIITPFNENEEIAFDKFKYNLEKWKMVPLKGAFYLCSFLFPVFSIHFLFVPQFKKIFIPQYLKSKFNLVNINPSPPPL